MNEQYSKKDRVLDQIKQYQQEKRYFEHYLANSMFILFGWEDGVVDYKVISHENKLIIHGFGRLTGTSTPLEARLR